MEFFCVFSVGGSLATYQVRKESGEEYKAYLRTSGGKQEDAPPEIRLWKEGLEWQAQPWNPEVVPLLLQAIEANNGKTG